MSEKVNNNNEESIFYDAEGNPYYVDMASNKVMPIKNDIKEAMKKDNGQWNKAIREQAKAMYLQDHSLTEISKKTKVPRSTIVKWVYGKKGDKSDKNCFYNVRKRRVDELLEQNKATVVAVNKGLLAKMKQYVEDNEVHITNSAEFKAFADSFAKMNLMDDGKNQNAQQTNIYMQPYSVKESREILESDPILAEHEDLEEVDDAS